jgi:hypothetical protein
VCECRCGADLRTIASEPADSLLIAINTVICRAVGFERRFSEVELNDVKFPPALAELKLDSILRAVRFLGSIQEDGRLRYKQPQFRSTDFSVAIQIGIAAATMLSDWPLSFRQTLRRTIPDGVERAARAKFNDVFLHFYRHLFGGLPRNDFRFLHDAFERFVMEDWPAPMHQQHGCFTSAVSRSARWIEGVRAAKAMHISHRRIRTLVRDGQLQGLFTRSNRLQKLWLNRESVNLWVARRDAELARYMSRREACRALGLTPMTIMNVARAGLIRHVRGPEQNFPRGFHFHREDIAKLQNAFERYAIPAREYAKAGELITLHDAVHNYLGNDSGLAAVIGAVANGTLIPSARNERFGGIMGYMFQSKSLRRYCPRLRTKAPPEGLLNYNEIASALHTSAVVVRGLVAHGIFGSPKGYRFHSSKLVPVPEVRRFAETYVNASVLAKSLQVASLRLALYLKRFGSQVLTIKVPQHGKARFVPRELAARIRISP